MNMNNAIGKPKLTILRKLLFVSALLLILPILTFGIVTYQVMTTETNALIEKGLKNNVKMAIEMIDSLENSVQTGTLSREEAEESLRVNLLGSLQADKTRPINDQIDLGDHGYFFVLDHKGNLLAHPLLEGQNIWDKQTSDGTYYIQEMITAAESGGGFTYYDWPLPDSTKEATKISYAETSASWGWIISAGSYMQDYNEGQREIVATMVITMIICLVVGLIVLTLFALHISRPIVRISEQSTRMAQGDLTGEAIVCSSKDEIGQLAVSFNTLLNNLREISGNQLLSANALASSSSSLSNVIGETVQSIHQTTESITALAANNETQAISIKESSTAMEEMAIGIGRIAISASSTFEASAATLREVEDGNKLITQSSEQMNSISITVGDLSHVVNQLGDRSERIGEIVEAIKEISEQTNLLALNASIEAARAGDHGKGFSVVASEIRKLAERSKDSASMITELISSILENITEAGNAMEKGELEVASGAESIHRTGEAFARILKATRSVVEQMEEASAAADQMSSSSQEISAVLQQMESLSSNSADASNTISAVTEEQLASMEEIASSARTLTQMSDNMRQQANKFKLS